MRDTIDILGWLFVALTTVALIFTLLTIYGFTYIKHFETYNTLQWCLFSTMAIWSVRMLKLKSAYRSLVYPLLCCVIAGCTIFFILMKVY